MAEPSGSSPEPALPASAVWVYLCCKSRGSCGENVVALCLLLVIVPVVILLSSTLHPNPGLAENDSVLSSGPDFTTVIPPVHADSDITENADTRSVVITTFTAPLSTRTNRSPVKVIVFSGTAPSGCDVSSGEVSSIAPLPADIALLEAAVHEQVNRARQINNISIIGTDSTLASVARSHSADMAARGYFGHINLHEMDATARGAAAGYRCSKGRDTSFTYPITENLYADYWYGSVPSVECGFIGVSRNTEETLAADAVDAWLRSPDHRRNLLDTHVEREGIGIAVSGDGLVFITEDLC